jgi:M6 family metalloprotease-like protein
MKMINALKKSLLFFASTLAAITASAMPAKPGLEISATQSDGSTITLGLIGDENFHSFVTTDGLTVSRGDDGNYYYRTVDGISNILVHNQNARSAAETAFISSNSSKMSMEALATAAVANGSMLKAPNRTPRRAGQVPAHDSPKIPVILVQYKDIKFKDNDPKATFESFFAEGDKSAHQYFVDQSNGKYTPEFDVLGPVTLDYNRAVYGSNNATTNFDQAMGQMVAEACEKVDSDVDFSQYDNDGDGICDVVIILYAGVGESTSGITESIWPCQWELKASDYGKVLKLDSTTINSFAVFNELSGFDYSEIAGIGTFCHEYSHCLGLPDFYDTNYGNHFGMGYWSVLDYGGYNDDGYTPMGYDAYEKWYLGWLDLEEYEEHKFYTLPVFNQKNIETDRAIKISSDFDPNEYYILENRAKQGWDKYIAAEGLMITHVTYDAQAWTQNTVNNYTPQRMTIIPADNSLKMVSYYNSYYVDESDLKGDLWPYRDANELTDTSTPAATLNTGEFMGKPITDITKNSDGTVSFWVMRSSTPAVKTPTNVSHTIESDTSASISWEPGDDNDVTYTVELKKYQEPTYTKVSSTDFTGNHDWTISGYVYNNGTETYIGSSKRVGSLTSPEFTTGNDGKATLFLTARYYDKDSKLKVSLLNAQGDALDSDTIQLTAGYDTYCILLNGNANETASICLENSEAAQRAYIKTADIYNGDATELSNDEESAAEAVLFTGIKETYLLLENLEEKETYEYRVKAVPTDQEDHADSKWSEKRRFTLGEENAVSNLLIDTNVAAEYFTLQGIRVKGTPTTPGIYVRRAGSQTLKVVVK